MKRNNKKVIGITGGIGAGKSTVLEYILQNYKVDVIRADEIGHILMEPGESVYEALVANYGRGILMFDDLIDTEKLAAIAFKDAESQRRINEIEHPLIKEEILARIRYASAPVVFVEAALLKEGGLTDVCDQVWYVTAPVEERIDRLIVSRSYSYEKCVSIMNRQLSEEAFAKIADAVINNGEDFYTTIQTVDQLMKKIGAERK